MSSVTTELKSNSQCACAGAAGGEGNVRYANGEILHSAEDLRSDGFGLPWGHARHFSNRWKTVGGALTTLDSPNGNNWMVPQWAHVVERATQTPKYDVVFGPCESYDFDGDTEATHFDNDASSGVTLERDSTTGDLKLSKPDGTVWEFYDFEGTETNEPHGMLHRVSKSSSIEIDIIYDTNGRPTSAEQSRVEGNTTYYERIFYTYNNNNMLGSVELQRGILSSGDKHYVTEAKVRYEYYDNNDEDEDDDNWGQTGDLKRAIRQVYNGSAWVDDKVTFYVYYTDSEGDGYPGGLKYVVGPKGFVALSTWPTVSEQAIADNADLKFTYHTSGENERKVHTVTLNGGERTITFAYPTPASTRNDLNHWQYKTVETLHSDNGKTITNIVYTNSLGRVLLKEYNITTSNPTTEQRWVEYWRYGTNSMSDYNQVILHAGNIACKTTYDAETYADLGYAAGLILRNTGFVHLYEYYGERAEISDDVDSGAPGRIHFEKIRRLGTTPTDYKLVEYAYHRRQAGEANADRVIYPLSMVKRYTEENATNPDSVITFFDFTYHSQTALIATKTTTLPLVPTAENGQGSTHTTTEQFDIYGNLTQYTCPRNNVTQHSYDLDTGARIRTVQDAGASPHLNLTTDYAVDDLGRTTATLGPVHDIDDGGTARTVRSGVWTFYNDEDHEVRTVHGYQYGTAPSITKKVVNPVQITRFDRNGNMISQISAVAASTEVAGVETESFAQSSFVRWTVHEYTHGRLTSTKVYHDIPASGLGSAGTNYSQTTYNYDVFGRQTRAQAPSGTITRTVYDDRGRVASTWVGTSDSTSWSPDNPGNSNLVKISESGYDYPGVAGSSLTDYPTGHTVMVDSNAANNRTTEFDYDWRMRQTHVYHPADADGSETLTRTTFDHLDRAEKVELYYDVVGTTTDRLLARRETFYDTRGRVYRTSQTPVNAATGAAGSTKLTADTVYDASGNVVKQRQPGSRRATKTEYDAVGRAVKQYLCEDNSETAYADFLTVDGDTVYEQTENTFDAAGNLTYVRRLQRYPGAAATGALVASNTLARASHVASWTDGIGRIVATADYGTAATVRPSLIPTTTATLLVTRYAFNNRGEQETVTPPNGKINRFEYDDAGRRTKTIENYVVSGTDPDENITVETIYNAGGQVGQLDAYNSGAVAHQVTDYVYGVTTGQSSTINSNDLLRAVIYPESDDPASLLSPGTDNIFDRVEYKYNRAGQAIEMKDQNETVHNYEYDERGRLLRDKVTFADGTAIDQTVKRIERSYNLLGLPYRIESYSATSGGTMLNRVEYAYNDLGMRTCRTDADSRYCEYAYDTTASGYEYTKGLRLTSMRYPNGRKVFYDYGSGADERFGLIKQLKDDNGSGGAGAVLATYKYLGASRIVGVKYDAISVEQTYFGTLGVGDPLADLDSFGRVLDHTWEKTITPWTKFDDLSHGYDLMGNRRYRNNQVISGKDEYYTYDDVNRLVAMDRGYLNQEKTGIAGTPAKEEDYSLDRLGNWTTFTQKTNGSTTLSQSRTHNAANETTALAGVSTHIAHDRAGNMTKTPKPAAFNQHYDLTFDAWNRVVLADDDTTTSSVVAQYKYDGEHRRIWKKVDNVETFYDYNHDWQLIEEREKIGQAATRLSAQYVWGLRYIDDLVLRDFDADDNAQTGNLGKTSSGLEQRLYALSDANWNVFSVVNTSGEVVERYVYDPYGRATICDSSWNPRTPQSSQYAWSDLFTGRRLDAETGLYHYRYRQYHPTLGRFVNRDPIGYKGGMSLYEYVGDAPITQTDLSGTQLGSKPVTPGAGNSPVVPEGGNSPVAPGDEDFPIEPGDDLTGWPPAPPENVEGQCSLMYCQSSVLGGLAHHTFTLLYIPGTGWVYYRGGPANRGKPYGALVCSSGLYVADRNLPDYPTEGNPTRVKCKLHTVSCKSPRDLHNCFAEVCRRITTGHLPYKPDPGISGLLGKSGNCHTTTSWLYRMCLEKSLMIPPKLLGFMPGIVGCKIPDCVEENFPFYLRPVKTK